MKKLGILFAIFLIASACKKEKIEPPIVLDENPVFSVIGNIGAQQISFQGGVSNAYLETYTIQSNGVSRFSGKLIQGENYVDFGVFDGQLFLPGANISQAGNQLKLTLDNNTEFLHIEKNTFSNAEFIQSISITSNGQDHGPKLSIYEPGIYNICVTATFNDSNFSTTTICNTVVVGYVDYAPFKIVNNLTQNGGLTASVECLNSAVSVSAVKWFVDNTQISTTTNLATLVSIGAHHLKAEVTFSNGITKTSTVAINAQNTTLHLQDINVFKSNPPLEILQDYKAQFSIKLNGILYKHIGSSEANQVTITGFSFYGKNAANKDVYKVSGVIICPMKNMNTGEISNAQFNVVFGLEIP